MIAFPPWGASLSGGVPRYGADGVDDPLVAGAAAEVAGEPLSDLLVSRIGVVPEEGGHGHDEARRAEPALQPVVVAEGRLHWREPTLGRGHALDRHDLGPVGLDGEHQASPHGVAVEQDGAGSTDP